MNKTKNNTTINEPKKDRTSMFTNRDKFWRNFALFTIPITFQMIIMIIFRLTGSIMASYMINPEAGSVMGLTMPIYLLGFILTMMMISGFSIKYNIAIGRGDKERANLVASTSLTFSVILTVVMCLVMIIFALPYMNWVASMTNINETYINMGTMFLYTATVYWIANSCTSVYHNLIRSEGKPQIIPVIWFCALGVLVLSNWLLIEYGGLGLASIAISQAIATLFALSLLMFYYHVSIKEHKNNFTWSKQLLRPNISVAIDISKLGILTTARQVGYLLCLFLIVISFLYLPKTNVNINNTLIKNYAIWPNMIILYTSLYSFMIIVPLALGISSNVFSGINYGIKSTENLQLIKKINMRYTLIAQIAQIVIFMSLEPVIYSLFNIPYYGIVSQQVANQVRNGYFIVVLALGFIGFNSMTTFYFTALHQPLKGILIAALNYLILFPIFWGVFFAMFLTIPAFGPDAFLSFLLLDGIIFTIILVLFINKNYKKIEFGK